MLKYVQCKYTSCISIKHRGRHQRHRQHQQVREQQQQPRWPIIIICLECSSVAMFVCVHISSLSLKLVCIPLCPTNILLASCARKRKLSTLVILFDSANVMYVYSMYIWLQYLCLCIYIVIYERHEQSTDDDVNEYSSFLLWVGFGVVLLLIESQRRHQSERERERARKRRREKVWWGIVSLTSELKPCSCVKATPRAWLLRWVAQPVVGFFFFSLTLNCWQNVLRRMLASRRLQRWRSVYVQRASSRE